MTALLETVEQEALNPPAEERAFLADRLLSSLGGEILTEVDAARVAEAEEALCGVQGRNEGVYSGIGGVRRG